MLNISGIENSLIHNKFCERHEIKYVIRFKYPNIDQYIYINKQCGKSYSSLVIHPRYISHRELFISIPGVQSATVLNHKSSMTKYPARLNNGERPTPYGIPFGFDTLNSLNNFLDALLATPYSYDSNTFDELENDELLKDNTLLSTEKEQLRLSRIGQGKFRANLIGHWNGCSVTGCKNTITLKASHIKPWRDSTNQERLDVNNGLLLIPNLDTLFDKGLISFNENGEIAISSTLDANTRAIFGITDKLKVKGINKSNKIYLSYHRSFIFQP